MSDRSERGSLDPENRGTFPTNAVVGIVDTPRDVVGITRQLRAQGITPDVYCGERAEEAIAHGHRQELDVRVARLVRGVFGFENEHSDRHMAEVDAGHYVVVAESHDNETTDVVRDAFAANGGRFVNYYSSWTSRALLP